MYGLKQAPCAWYTKIGSYFTRLRFTKSEANVNLSHIVVEGKFLIIVLYVNDLIIIGDEKMEKSCKEDLAREFEMKDLGLMPYFLGMEVLQGDEELFISQGKYDNEILKNPHMESSKAMETPLAGNCRKEEVTSDNQLSQAMVKPSKLYWNATKHVLRYLIGTTHFGLWYRRTKGMKPQGFTYANWAGSPFDMKRTLGGIFSIGSTTISLYNKKQRSIALNSEKPEYTTAS
eukprot:PITA_18032